MKKAKLVNVRVPNELEMFYIKWENETLKENINIINDISGKLLTFSLAIFTGTLFLNVIENKIIQIIISFLSLLSVIMSLICIMPIHGKYIKDDFMDFKTKMEYVFKRKKLFLYSNFVSILSPLILFLFYIMYTRK